MEGFPSERKSFSNGCRIKIGKKVTLLKSIRLGCRRLERCVRCPEEDEEEKDHVFHLKLHLKVHPKRSPLLQRSSLQHTSSHFSDMHIQSSPSRMDTDLQIKQSKDDASPLHFCHAQLYGLDLSSSLPDSAFPAVTQHVQRQKYNPRLFTCFMPSTDVSESPPKDVPKGYVAVYVGRERQRFVIPVVYLNHPVFEGLLREAEDEFGFEQKGPLSIPCNVNEFEKRARMAEKGSHRRESSSTKIS